MQQSASFDTWTSVFLVAVAMGLFLFVLLMTTKNRKNFPIAFLVLAFSVILFQYVLYWTGYQDNYPYLIMLPAVCYYASGPLLYLYFLNLYEQKVRFNYILHFTPALLVLVPNIVLWLTYAELTSIAIPLQWLVRNPWLIAAHMLIYCLLVFILVRRKHTETTQYTELRKRWSVILLSLFTLFVISYLAYFVLVRFPFFNDQWDYFISMTMSLSIYAIGFFIFNQPQVFDGEFHANLFLPTANGNDTLEQSMLNELYRNVTNFMETRKPYVENELRLVHLADRLGFSTHLLSKVINSKSGENFNQFINNYRLKEAEYLLSKSSDLSIQNIYYEVGFNNKATFYTAFRKKYGCTPSQFRNSVLQS